MFCCGISVSTNSAVICLTSLLFNKTVNRFNSIIERNFSFFKLYYIVQKISLFESRVAFLLFTLYIYIYSYIVVIIFHLCMFFDDIFICTSILTQIMKLIDVSNVHHSFQDTENDYNLESYMAYIGLRQVSLIRKRQVLLTMVKSKQ